MVEPSLATLAAATALAAFVTGFLRASVGGGIGLALTPVLSVVLPTGAGALVAANCLKVVSYWTMAF